MSKEETKLYLDDEETGLSRETSHPNFTEHFSEEFYYDCVDDESPFGNDNGADTLYELEDLFKSGDYEGKILGLPKKIVSVKGIIGNNQLEVNIKDELLENNFYLADLSAIHFDDIDRRLYLLSDESALLGRIDDKKDFKKYLDLMDNEISSKMKNSEGITRDKEGNIYIVSEPNLFFSIKKE